jgi:hypothetical protein
MHTDDIYSQRVHVFENMKQDIINALLPIDDILFEIIAPVLLQQVIV